MNAQYDSMYYGFNVDAKKLAEAFNPLGVVWRIR